MDCLGSFKDRLGYVWVDFELLGLKPKESKKGTKLAFAGWWFVEKILFQENTFQGVPILDAFKSPTLIEKKRTAQKHMDSVPFNIGTIDIIYSIYSTYRNRYHLTI